MVTRVRVEASAKIEQEVKDELLATSFSIRLKLGGGEWKYDEEVQTTKNGFWGYMTITRED